ncbi:hypothetical protein GCM10009592_28450 [Brachybacterium rhamnosum]|uniref:Uncharacterized protein n=1 Tax=Brachybacterium rhamnosum TaxID=173361 RepID=A0ABW4PZY0_9MICO
MTATRIRDGLICLAEGPFWTLEAILGTRPPCTGEVKASMSRPWAYQKTRHAFHYESVDTWGGWYAHPRNAITWDELDKAIAEDPRLPEIRAWSESLTAVDAWRDRMRPHRLTTSADQWHPSYHESDETRPGWAARLHAWESTIALLRDAAARTPDEPEQLDLLDFLETT